MGAIQISIAEKRLLQHLSLGGNVTDSVGRELVTKFISVAYQDAEISKIARDHGISMNDACILYASMIQCLMPNPCIETGGLLLTPTLFFMEPFRFTGLASEISSRTSGMDEAGRREKMIALAASAAQQTWNAHTSARGEAKFIINNVGGRKSSGCAVLLLMGCFVGFGVACFAIKFLI